MTGDERERDSVNLDLVSKRGTAELTEFRLRFYLLAEQMEQPSIFC